MSHNGRRAAVILTALVALLYLPPVVFGQPKHTPKIIEITILPQNDASPVTDVDLRPNTPTEFGFEVKNRAGQLLGDVKLTVFQVGQKRVIAEANIPILEQTPEDKDGFRVLKFDKPPVKLDGDKTKAPPENLVLEGSPPFKLEVHIHYKNLKEPIIREFNLVVFEPRLYVEPTTKHDPAKDLLTVSVVPKGLTTFLGPRLVPLKLELSPEVAAKAKSLEAELTPEDAKATMEAGELAFEKSGNEGDVHLTVDGYQRAFTYRVRPTFNGAITPRKPSEIRVRIGVPRYALPDAKFKVPLEIDGPLTDNYKVQVGLDGIGAIKEFIGLREQTVILGVSPKNKLICEAVVRDRQVEFNTKGINGLNVKVRVSVLKDGKKEELTVAPEFRPLWAKTQPDNQIKVLSVFAVVTVDDSEPEGILIGLPKDKVWTTGVPPLEIRARYKERKPTQAPVVRAILIRGKVPKDDKQEPQILAEGELDPKLPEWIFALPPQSNAETLPFSVVFMTATRAKAAAFETVTFKADPQKKLHTIKGRVLENGRPQQGIDVFLLDDKGKEKAKAKTSPKGEYVFENVEPGVYSVTSMDDTKKRTALKKVDVPVKDNKEVVLDLFAK